MIHHADDWLTIHGGDARDVLPELAADSVDCIVTSPPYWGLRDYGTATWVGGDEDHAHIGSVARTAPPGTAKQASLRGSTDVYSGDCGCGAVRQDGQLGLVANRLSRRAILIDLNPAYLEQQMRRNAQIPVGL